MLQVGVEEMWIDWCGIKTGAAKLSNSVSASRPPPSKQRMLHIMQQIPSINLTRTVQIVFVLERCISTVLVYHTRTVALVAVSVRNAIVVAFQACQGSVDHETPAFGSLVNAKFDKASRQQNQAFA